MDAWGIGWARKNGRIAQRWAVPGANIFYAAPGYKSIGLFQARAITQDATNTYIRTNEVGGFPTIASPIQFISIGSAQFTCDACTGDAPAKQLPRASDDTIAEDRHERAATEEPDDPDAPPDNKLYKLLQNAMAKAKRQRWSWKSSGPDAISVETKVARYWR